MVRLLILGARTLNYTPPGRSALGVCVSGAGGVFLWYWRRGGQTSAMQTWKLRIVTPTDGNGIAETGLAALCPGLAVGAGWPGSACGGHFFDPDRQFSTIVWRARGSSCCPSPKRPKALQARQRRSTHHIIPIAAIRKTMLGARPPAEPAVDHPEVGEQAIEQVEAHPDHDPGEHLQAHPPMRVCM